MLSAAACVGDETTTAFAVRIDNLVHGAIEARLAQRVDHQLALPGPVSLRSPVLDRAAAATAEMRTERSDPVRALTRDTDQAAAIGTSGVWFDGHFFARERIGNKDGLPIDEGDAIPAMADIIDLKVLSHDGPR